MKEHLIDIQVPIEMGEVADTLTTTEAKNALSAEIVEMHRVKAEQEVRAVGGRLRTDSAPEFYIRRGSHVIEGGDWLITSSRWKCEVPNSFDPEFASQRSR